MPGGSRKAANRSCAATSAIGGISLRSGTGDRGPSADSTQKRPGGGVSGGRERYRAAQKAKGRRRGHGSREGALNARTPQKRRWISVIRGMRRHLRELRDHGRIDVHPYRRFYAQAKGGMFKSKAHLDQQLRAAGAVRDAAK